MRLLNYINEAKEMLKDWKKYVNSNKELAAAVKIMNQINKKGYKSYIVGGAVRDIILGDLKPHDIDIATNMPIEEINKIYKTYDIGKSKDFGIIVVKQNGFDFEVAQFRNDGKYTDGRRPEKVQVVGNFEDDAGRRDFTINAMGINAKGEVIDYFDGKKDIQDKVIKTVGDPAKRFGEDYLRMLRAPRFASKLGFEIDKSTKKAIQKLSPNIKDLSPERVKDELLKAASQSGEKFANYIKILDDLKLLKFILPEVMNLKWYKENLHHHPETKGGQGVFTHVMSALRVSDTYDPIKNLAILLHDVGKGVTLSHKNGLPRYLQHAKASIDLVLDIAKRLKMSNKEKDALVFAVGNHMRFHNILNMKPSKIAKLVNDDNCDVLVAVARADEYSRGNTFMYAGEFEKIVDKAVKIKEKFGIKNVQTKLKLVDGNKVMKLTGLKPGKKVGEIIKKTTEWIIDNNIDTKNQGKINKYIMSLV